MRVLDASNGILATELFGPVDTVVPADVPRIDIAGRRAQLIKRARDHGTRTRAAHWTP
jgi:hypothetical protein